MTLSPRQLLATLLLDGPHHVNDHHARVAQACDGAGLESAVYQARPYVRRKEAQLQQYILSMEAPQTSAFRRLLASRSGE